MKKRKGKIYVVSLLATRLKGGKQDIEHCPLALRATSDDEAFGKATRLLDIAYPKADWGQRHVAVRSLTKFRILNDVDKVTFNYEHG